MKRFDEHLGMIVDDAAPADPVRVTKLTTTKLSPRQRVAAWIVKAVAKAGRLIPAS